MEHEHIWMRTGVSTASGSPEILWAQFTFCVVCGVTQSDELADESDSEVDGDGQSR